MSKIETMRTPYILRQYNCIFCVSGPILRVRSVYYYIYGKVGLTGSKEKTKKKKKELCACRRGYNNIVYMYIVIDACPAAACRATGIYVLL